MGGEGDRIPIRFARGCRAFAVRHGEEILAYGWLSSGPEWVGELGLHITPAPGEAYVWNCLTLEPHRRRGHYRAILRGITAVARAEGLHRLWIGSVDVPAEKADADAGFERVLRFSVSRLGPVRRLAISAAEGADPRTVEEARSRLGLRSSTHVGRFRRRVH